MTKPSCAVDGCERRAAGKGYCSAHYARWKKSGDPGPAEIAPPVRNGDKCIVDGCARSPISRNLCHPHYTRWRAKGDPGPATIRSRMASGGKCTFPGCEERHEAHGLCPGHYAQHRGGRPLVPLEARHKTTLRDDQGRKRCNACKGWFPESDFDKNKTPADGLATSCRPCHRNRALLLRYGITWTQFDALLEQHGGACAICRRPNPNRKRLSVDHDHSCCPDRDRGCGECVRGLLCNNCNMGIGFFADNPEVLLRAAAYLAGGGWRAVVET